MEELRKPGNTSFRIACVQVKIGTGNIPIHAQSVTSTPPGLTLGGGGVTPWPESASEPYRPSDRRLSAKFVSTFADRECHVVSVTDRYGRILGFLDRSRYFFFQVAPQLYSRD
jgi:hypothetical protein